MNANMVWQTKMVAGNGRPVVGMVLSATEQEAARVAAGPAADALRPGHTPAVWATPDLSVVVTVDLAPDASAVWRLGSR